MIVNIFKDVHSVSPSVHPHLLGYLVYVIFNSKSFHSFLFQLCIMIVNILMMCTFYFVHIFSLIFEGC